MLSCYVLNPMNCVTQILSPRTKLFSHGAICAGFPTDCECGPVRRACLPIGAFRPLIATGRTEF